MGADALQRQTHRLKLTARRVFDDAVGLRIRTAVEKLYRLPRGQLRRPEKTEYVAYIRALTMWLFKQELNWSYPRVGLAFKRDHSTVFFAVTKVNIWLTEGKPEVLRDIQCLRVILQRATQTITVPGPPEKQPPAICTFCGRGEHEVKNIVRSGDETRPAAICQDCVLIALQGILQQEGS
jgi:hypothetical protein